MELEEMLLLKEEYLEALETKNAELEKHNEMLAHQLKYAETILTEVQADKFKLRGKLEIADSVIRYYKDQSNWFRYDGSTGSFSIIRNEDISWIVARGQIGEILCGGKKAREYFNDPWNRKAL